MVIKKNKENKKRVFDTGKPLLTPAPTLCFFVFPSSLGPAGADGKLNVQASYDSFEILMFRIAIRFVCRR
jgi:hypothetical protein